MKNKTSFALMISLLLVGFFIGAVTGWNFWNCGRTQALDGLLNVAPLPIPDGKAKAAPGFVFAEGDGRERTLGEAEAYWKSHRCGMARLSDYYAMAGSLAQEQLASIRKDLRTRWIVTDRLDYAGKMVSVNGGEYVECPEYDGVPLAKVLGTPAGLKLFQALCGTMDGADAIMRKLEKLSSIGRGGIRVWTLDMDSRRAYPSRAASFYYCGGVFHVLSDFDPDNFGCSRGVRVR